MPAVPGVIQQSPLAVRRARVTCANKRAAREEAKTTLGGLNAIRRCEDAGSDSARPTLVASFSDSTCVVRERTPMSFTSIDHAVNYDVDPGPALDFEPGSTFDPDLDASIDSYSDSSFNFDPPLVSILILISIRIPITVPFSIPTSFPPPDSIPIKLSQRNANTVKLT
ncbi:hypothetical protein EVAR_62569_1 [Eumeta japonica]|uniref:Uncharacterized protein n=1 Tax=Eumeta variegata TaxID=151549 RepID=A0A4C1YR85_EUMVA|nr:hypothetical protein EVAR_62569_1 [Eumeta japonica]